MALASQNTVMLTKSKIPIPQAHEARNAQKTQKIPNFGHLRLLKMLISMSKPHTNRHLSVYAF